jgi:hypothetical protein
VSISASDAAVRQAASVVTKPNDYPYVYRWNRAGRKGALCKVTARGTLNSARVEFEDGFVMITSRNALKRAEPRPKVRKPRPESPGRRG